MSERQGVEIDYCPECRGVWLDRGELDKILERAEPGDRRDDPRGDDDRDDRRRSEDPDDRRRVESTGHQPKKKRSFLSEIFEFGGD